MISFIFASLGESIRDRTSIIGMISAGVTGAISKVPNSFWPQNLGETLTAIVSLCTVGYILTKWILLLKKGKREAVE